MGTTRDWLAWLRGILDVTLHVFLQRWQARRVPPLAELRADVEGRTCIVTGPTSGIGRQTAGALVARRAHVVLACRSQQRGDRLKEELLAEAAAAGDASPHIEVQLLDVADLTSVRAFAERWGERPLHVLINNAGVFNFSGAAWGATRDGLEPHLATNCVGPHLLTLLLLPALRAAAQGSEQIPSRVVNVSSGLHRLGRPQDWGQPASALGLYSGSKFAQVALTAELSRRLTARGVNVLCLQADPGEVLTDIVRDLYGPIRVAYQTLLPRILLTVQQGACSSVFAAGSPSFLADRPKEGYAYIGSNCQRQAAAEGALQPHVGAGLWREAAKAVRCTSQELRAAVN